MNRVPTKKTTVSDRAEYQILPDQRGTCAERSCMAEAAFRAPVAKRSDGEIVYRYFCKLHARQWNGRWNYFADMTDQQADRLQHFLKTGHFRSDDDRLYQAIVHNYGSLSEEIKRLRGDQGFASQHQSTDHADLNHIHKESLHNQRAVLSAPIRLALSQLQLKTLPDKATLQRHFRLLIKRYHPDVQKCPREKQRGTERLKLINAAYACVQRYLESKVAP